MKLLTKIALTGIGLVVLMWLAIMTPMAAHAKTCGAVSGTDPTIAADAKLFTFLDGSCSSDNQANDGDDLKAFLDKGGQATFNGPDIDFSLTKNSSALIDQNTEFKDLSAGTSSAQGFTDGNGFANIKSVGDALQSWEVDPIPGSVFGKLAAKFLDFDGMLFRGQFVDLPGAVNPKQGDAAQFTLVIHLSDGSFVTNTFSGLKLKADDGVFGFDEVGTLPAGLFVDSVTAVTDPTHAWDQIKQVEFSIGGAVGVIPETRTWAMLVIGFGLMGALGYRRRTSPMPWMMMTTNTISPLPNIQGARHSRSSSRSLSCWGLSVGFCGVWPSLL